MARRADVARVALYHHDPSRTDDEVDELVAGARARAAAIGYRGEVFAAAEGMSIEVRGTASQMPERARVSLATHQPALATSTGSVLIVGRTDEIMTVLREAAGDEGFEVDTSAELSDAFSKVVANQPTTILLEAFADDGGFDLVAAIRTLGTEYGRGVPVIMVGPTSARWRPDAVETGITEWLVWPSTGFYVRTKLRAWHLRQAARWQAAPIPDDEEQRLAALHALGVLDTEPEERFDRYTAEIARTLDVPVALVSLVDADRQWFKSHHGTDAKQTPRDVSLCAHAIHGDDVFEVPDALIDDRFADNPMVKNDPRVRFYAGMPLRLADGSAVGTLCVIDQRPRRLDDRELDELRRVAGLVTAELELR